MAETPTETGMTKDEIITLLAKLRKPYAPYTNKGFSDILKQMIEYGTAGAGAIVHSPLSDGFEVGQELFVSYTGNPVDLKGSFYSDGFELNNVTVTDRGNGILELIIPAIVTGGTSKKVVFKLLNADNTVVSNSLLFIIKGAS